MARLRIVSKNEKATHISLKENSYIHKHRLSRRLNIILFIISAAELGFLLYVKYYQHI